VLRARLKGEIAIAFSGSPPPGIFAKRRKAMLRLRLFIAVITAVLVVNAFGFISCTREKPTEPTQETRESHATINALPDRNPAGDPQEWYVQTSEQLDTLLDQSYGVDIIDGDTLRLKADTLFNLGAKTYPPLQSMGLYILGDLPRPTIKSSHNSGATAVITIQDSSEERRVVLRNFAVNCSTISSDRPLIHTQRHAVVECEGVTGYLRDAYFFFMADSVSVSDCNLTATVVCVDATHNTNADPVYVFDNVTMTTNSIGASNHGIMARFTNVSGSVTVKNSSFYSANSANKYYLRCLSSTSAELDSIDVVIQDNSMSDGVGAWLDGGVGASSGIKYKINFQRNTLDTGDCPYFDDNGEVGVEFLDDPVEWIWNGQTVSEDLLYYEIGQIENVVNSKKYCDSEHWLIASFDLSGDTTNVFRHFMTPTVKYGISTGNLSNTGIACWNPNLDKWFAEMNHGGGCGGKTCPSFWEVVVSFCDSTGTSSEQSYTYPTTTGPCKDPLLCD